MAPPPIAKAQRTRNWVVVSQRELKPMLAGDVSPLTLLRQGSLRLTGDAVDLHFTATPPVPAAQAPRAVPVPPWPVPRGRCATAYPSGGDDRPTPVGVGVELAPLGLLGGFAQQLAGHADVSGLDQQLDRADGVDAVGTAQLPHDALGTEAGGKDAGGHRVRDTRHGDHPVLCHPETLAPPHGSSTLRLCVVRHPGQGDRESDASKHPPRFGVRVACDSWSGASSASRTSTA